MSTNLYPVVRRGDIFYADLGETVGSEQGGTRPVMVIQNNVGNIYSPTVIVAAITSKIKKEYMPTHITIGAQFGLAVPSSVLFEQIRTIDRQRLREYVGTVDSRTMAMLDRSLAISIGLNCGTEVRR